ncbi:MAG: divergent polysaccharide deacetylase family protein [Desulfuromonadaceae bacterium]
MASDRHKKSRHSRTSRPRLTTLIAFALMLGAIIGGLLILSHQPGTEEEADLSREQADTHAGRQIYSDPLEHRTPPASDNLRDSVRPDKKLVLPVPLLDVEKPRVAIIMDDLGASPSTARQVAGLDVQITMAIIPDLDYAQQTMRIAEQHAREVMAHLPMEPLNYPHNNPGKMALMRNMNDAEITSRTAYYLRKLPLARGCNNHMGSAFTQEPHQMELVLEQLSKRGLYFIDSLTSSTSVGAEQARKLNIPHATRDVFLDNERDSEKITRQLKKLFRIAQHTGSAIGICHPYPETISVLESSAELAAEYGVNVVPASSLVH